MAFGLRACRPISPFGLWLAIREGNHSKGADPTAKHQHVHDWHRIVLLPWKYESLQLCKRQTDRKTLTDQVNKCPHWKKL
jgi:hypothetical protein